MRSPSTVNAGQSWNCNAPVRPGDIIQPTGVVKSKQATAKSRWVLIDVMVRNQTGEKAATGHAMIEFLHR